METGLCDGAKAIEIAEGQHASPSRSGALAAGVRWRGDVRDEAQAARTTSAAAGAGAQTRAQARL